MNILNSERRVSSDELRSESMHRWLRTCTNPKSQIPNPKSSRRGILLLVVLSMLTLFLMIGMAYLVSANHYRKTNKTMAQASITSYLDIDRGELLEQALFQLVRDTGNQFSSIRFHSLLRDMYGNDGFVGVIDRVRFAPDPADGSNATNTQIIEFDVGNTKDYFGIPITLSSLNNTYNGLVLTFVSKGQNASAEGISTRIVGFIAPNTIRVLAFPLADGSTLSSLDTENQDAPILTALDTSRILINGRPFNGTGVGLDRFATTGERAIANELVNGTPRKVALMPNASFLDVLQVTLPSSTTELTFEEYFLTDQEIENLSAAEQETLVKQRGLVGLGGSDESYDAPDFQNMALAMMQKDPSETRASATDLGKVVLPSFHRPALINYWANGQSIDFANPMNASLLRKVLLRPNWFDHPNFTGSNPEYALAEPTEKINRMIYGPWDVDNDNDGVRDGIWTDIGSPVMAGPDGRLVKPLVSFLVLDLDGRANVNAHGTLEHLGTVNLPIPERNVAGEQNLSSLLPQGQGYGPADISLRPLFNNNILENILLGTNTGMAGRYGHDVPGDRFKSRPGDNSNFDMKAQLKMQGVPRWANARDTDPSDYMLSAYVTPPDFHGRYRLGINDFGQPVYEAQFDGVELEQDSPYEMDLSPGGSRGESVSSADAPYSLAELERLLRAYDVDAGTLPSRLWDFSLNGATTPDPAELAKWRALLTTDSYDLPVPNVVVPQWMAVGPDSTPNTSDDYSNRMGRPPTNASFADLLEYQIRQKLDIVKATETADDLAQVMAFLNGGEYPTESGSYFPKLLTSNDLADGLRMDINRPFGNGRDDNDDGVVDEPGEQEGSYWQMRLANGNLTLTDSQRAFTDDESHIHDSVVDRDGNGTIDAVPTDLVLRDNLRRQDMARDLYVLAMTLVDPLPTTATPEQKQARSRQLAQWAINAVDFRDPDNIMTAFEYDENPFDGWQVDGNLTTTNTTTEPNRAVVWGTERPELVMTETLAWHDRRTTDETMELHNPNEDAGSILAANKPDSDYDQLYRPRGAFFLELYNPWPENPAANADTHAKGGLGGRTDFDRDDKDDPLGQDLGVNLGAIAVDPNNPAIQHPVWRLSIHKPDAATVAADTLLWDPDDPDTRRHPAPNSPTADRTVYFTRDADVDAATLKGLDNFDGAEYFTTMQIPCVRPGRYLVVGSGEEEVANSEYFAPLGKSLTGGNPRGIRLRPNSPDQPLVYEEPDENNVAPPRESDLPVDMQVGNSDTDFSICNVAVINRVVDVFGTPKNQHLSITEPPTGYPRVVKGVQYTEDGGPDGKGWYGTKDQRQPLDTPFDEVRTDGETRLRLPGDVNEQRIIECFSWIYLQRLANPMLPFDKDTNPYLTVDAISANATVFNGEVKAEERWSKKYVESSGKKPAEFGLNATLKYRNDFATAYFASHQRGYTARKKGQEPQLWELERANGGQDPKKPGGDVGQLKQRGMERVARNRMGRTGTGRGSASHTFDAIVDCTLGYMNRHYLNASDPNNPNELMALTASLSLQDLYDNLAMVRPEKPFPWLNWNNRPFISSNELTQVPVTRSSQLTRAYTNRAMNANFKEKYSGAMEKWPGQNAPKTISLDGAFGHQANFFRHAVSGNDGIAGLHRVLEYLHVPSRFVGTEMWLNPASFGQDVTDTTDPRMGRQPPFNRISSYRDPGQMNLNTIASDKAYFALMHGNPSGNPRNVHAGPTWNRLRASRRGYGTDGNDILSLRDDVPTFFENPFRSAEAGDLVPVLHMTRVGVECTLLRSDEIGGVTSDTADPLFGASSVTPHNNVDRNPFFRYQPLTRLDNLTTTRSNVYAVWVTVGFFEVEAAPSKVDFKTTNDPSDSLTQAESDAIYDRVYPEGYQLGKEAGIDTGDVERVREFAIIDRSIPVAFEPGADHNVEKAMRLRRRIE